LLALHKRIQDEVLRVGLEPEMYTLKLRVDF
jgi:hypothetical protein